MSAHCTEALAVPGRALAAQRQQPALGPVQRGRAVTKSGLHDVPRARQHPRARLRQAPVCVLQQPQHLHIAPQPEFKMQLRSFQEVPTVWYPYTSWVLQSGVVIL